MLRSAIPPAAKPVIDYMRSLKPRDDCLKGVSRKSFEFVSCAVKKYNLRPDVVNKVAVRRMEPDDSQLLTAPKFLTFDQVFKYAKSNFV